MIGRHEALPACQPGRRAMFDEADVQCPYCGEACSLSVEIDVEGSFVQDCEVCCRPWAVTVSRDEDGEVHVSVERSD